MRKVGCAFENKTKQVLIQVENSILPETADCGWRGGGKVGDFDGSMHYLLWWVSILFYSYSLNTDV